MSKVFADAHYWVAIINDQDQSHAAAKAISRTLQGTPIFTTEEALTEVLAFFSERGRHLRRLTAATVRSIAADPMIHVVPQSHQSFLTGLALYEARPDKGYSLTDCISMLVMHREGITKILTHDNHFTQEGFTKLL
jgi:predicted nucleic acid-binding protein